MPLGSPLSNRFTMSLRIDPPDDEPEEPDKLFDIHHFPHFKQQIDYLNYFNNQYAKLQKQRNSVLALKSTVYQQHERYQTLSFYQSDYEWGNYIKIDQTTELLIGSAPILIAPFYQTLYQFKPSHLFMLTNFVENKTLAKRYFPLCKNEPDWLKDLAVQYEKQVKYEENQKMSFGVGFENVQIDVDKMEWGKEILHFDNLDIKSKYIGGEQNKYLDIEIEIDGQTNNKRNDKEIEQEQSNIVIPLHAALSWKDFGTSDEALSFEEMKVLCDQALHQKTACHCSAGIGRAAVFASCLIVYEQYMNGKDVNYDSAADAMERLRLTRSPSAVQKDYQFKYIMDFCDWLMKQHNIRK